jgi:hypothetical protein
MNILDEITTYVANKLNLEPGENIFYNSLPDEPDDALLIQLLPRSLPTPSPIDAECYVIEVSSRSMSNDVAYQQAESAYRWLYTDKEDTADADGIVNISENLSVATLMLNTPAWKQTDNNGRKYFTFRVRVFSHRII